MPSTNNTSPFDHLNPAQRRAVEHGITGNGPNIAGAQLVIAGAGSGKTRVITSRFANLVLHGADPNRILVLAFTRAAADEMKARMTGLIATHLKGRVVALSSVGTFHSVATRLLRTNAKRIGLTENFNVLDRGDAATVMGRARLAALGGKAPDGFPSKAVCFDIYSFKVNARKPLKKVLRMRFPEQAIWRKQLNQIFEAYVAEKQRNNVLDYDDLLLYWAVMLSDTRFARRIGGMFDHVLVVSKTRASSTPRCKTPTHCKR